jgi:superfamily I DNA/RNA helicase
MCKWNPQLLVSTIHGVKGGEADNVALLLSATKKTKANIFNDIDDELRVLYVGITRTKKNLFLIDSENENGFNNIIQTIKEENGLVW